MSYRNEQPGQRRGFLAALSAALSPQPIPENDTGPLTAPRGVLAATVLSILAGVIYIFSGGLGISRLSSMLAQSKTQYQTWIKDCTSKFGGIGTSAITQSSPTGSAATCQGLREMTTADWSSFRTASLVVSVVFLLMGVALVLAGWFLRFGRRWARRVLVGVAIITVLAAMMLGMTSPIILGATLLMIIGVLLCYLSSGATYFLRVAARRHS
ncbi:MAG: hypothetical protein BGO26_11905 [Actinobacteria bacterium 69-20]|nr:hypothetical protein [Actinomycetota bacterium]OJV26607.1 MAG: hypothetical protein BGO26_11905 [Actinobacteria bacterium 69-20]